MINKKAQAQIQLVLVVLSIFAFAHIMHQSDGNFIELEKEYNSLREQKLELIANLTKKLITKLTSPIIPLVSANNLGCCDKTINNERCAITIPELCTPGRLFAENVMCDQTSFCKTGCCVDDTSGTCDKNTPRDLCQGVWTEDQNCNTPQCQLGCCNLGNSGILATEKQCEVYTEVMVLGENKVTEWDPTISEAACVMSSLFEAKGACLTPTSDEKKTCEMLTNKECLSITGSLANFVEGKLCTSPEIGTICEPTEETTCVEGKDGVYFVDSCGNPSNIYDSSRAEDPFYWDNLISPTDSCNAGNGNANSANCGNCDRFEGGKCSSATEDKFEVSLGENYCKQTSCLEDGELYKNGESWCVYDGAIGNGDDVVGSRHWRRVCNLGEIVVEPCADYRNQICVQSDTLEAQGTNVDFQQAFCRPNMWKDCISANSEEDEDKINTLDCVTKKIDGGGSFNLEFTAPAFPPGFNLKGGGAIASGEDICSMASLTCTYTEVAKTWGGCEVADGDYCKTPEVAEQMNDFCRSLGDCGLAANYIGEVQKSCGIIPGNLDQFSQTYRTMLASLANPVKGQSAPIGDLDKYLDAAGISTEYIPGEESTMASTLNMVGMGLGAVGYFAKGYGVTQVAGVTNVAHAGINAFGAAAMGAAIGMMVGGYLAKMGGAPAGWAMVAMAAGAVAGAIVGLGLAASAGSAAAAGALGAVGLLGPAGSLLALGPVGWIVLAVLVVIMLVASFLFGGSCEVTDVEFTCEPWQPPIGGDQCHVCNEDPLKPCSEYRCQSLGAACEFLNPGTIEEVCAPMKNDAKPPIITMGNAPDGTIFVPTENGFKITKENGDCLNAYEMQLISFSTNKPAQCKFASNEFTEFENMPANFGTAYYVYDHILPFNMPDPSHGMSRGINWSGEMELFVLCQDAYANAFRVPYKIETCIYQGQDITPPVITRTEPASNTLLRYNTTSTNFTVYTTEPSTCKWSMTDEKFDKMINPMTCETDLLKRGLFGYECKTTLPIDETQNSFFVACQDQPWLEGTEDKPKRVAMTGNVRINLDRVESPIKIDNIAPNEDVETDTTMRTTTLGVQTSLGGQWHTCSYSFSGYETMITFLHTGERVHTQDFNLPLGTHKIYVECEDETGDTARGEANFRVLQDNSAPKIARIFRQGATIKVITTEEAECRYSSEKCSFPFTEGITMGSGIEHSISSKGGEVYYVKCKDEWENAPSSCSITIAGI